MGTIYEPATFKTNNFHIICNELAKIDEDLKRIIDVHGYPPMWTRENSFETLVHIILEQQVSLASALSALNMLKVKTKSITPESILLLTDEEMRGCYVSRQKTGYIRGLAEAILSEKIQLGEFEKMSNEEVRSLLIHLKGIGNWTIDIYLMFVLQRTDVFPIGDLAAVNALKRLKDLPLSTTKEEMLEISTSWQPYRTVATMLLWHYYLSNIRKVKL